MNLPSPDLFDHPAVLAWTTLQPERRIPRSIKRLKVIPSEIWVYRLDGVGPEGRAVIAKRCARDLVLTERTVYQDLLPRLAVPNVRCLGVVEEVSDEFAWLFVEDAGGEPYAPERIEHRKIAGAWLGRLHAGASTLGLESRLPDRPIADYLDHLRQAREAIRLNLDNRVLKPYRRLLRTAMHRCDLLEARWAEVEQFCGRVPPRTLVHGDFGLDHLRVRTDGAEPVLVSFDWGSSRWCVPAVDLAQFENHEVRYGVMPDLEAYWAAVREAWPTLALEDIRRLAAVGTVCRSLYEMHGESWRLAYDYRHDYEIGWLVEFMTAMRLYVAKIGDLLQADGSAARGRRSAAARRARSGGDSATLARHEPRMTRREAWAVDRPVRRDHLVFGSPQILEEEIEEVSATLRSGWIGTGPKVTAFEQQFREYVGADHAIAVSSCTAALHLSLVAIGLQPGDEVIVPAMTFASTANVVIHAGGTPVLADVDRATMCLDAERVTRRITPRTRAILPVHFAGRPCPIDDIRAIAQRHGLRIVEDCAHAIETLDRGRHAGTLGDAGAFSFYVTKNVTTAEGGMVTTADPGWAARIRALALHGLSADAWKRFSAEGFQHYDVLEPGFKYNMTDLQAALGLHQLARVESNLVRREKIWARYDRAFVDLPVFLAAPAADGTRHGRHLYTLLLDLDRLRVGRDAVVSALHRQRIGTGIHYRAVHLHRYYRERFGYAPGDLPNAEWISERTLSLPLSPKLTDEDVDDVVFAVRGTLEHFAR